MNTQNNSPRLCTNCCDNQYLIDKLTEENEKLIKENDELKKNKLSYKEVMEVITDSKKEIDKFLKNYASYRKFANNTTDIMIMLIKEKLNKNV